MVARQPRTLITPLSRLPEREDHFRWLVKVRKQKYVFIAPHGKLDLSEPAKLINARIAVLRASQHRSVLQGEGFTNIAECATVKECVHMVKTGLADAGYGSDDLARSAINNDGNKESDFDISPVFRLGEVWLASSLDVTEDEARKWRAAMDALRADGTVARILRKYGMQEN